ncbi:hypothetical protein JCM33374_g6292 [Metschnikowia sp. JCM 33374]|nr:hypothetical protein JCM33374_g6292 [Metschnikowia sp. JCM 33374]
MTFCTTVLIGLLALIMRNELIFVGSFVILSAGFVIRWGFSTATQKGGSPLTEGLNVPNALVPQINIDHPGPEITIGDPYICEPERESAFYCSKDLEFIRPFSPVTADTVDGEVYKTVSHLGIAAPAATNTGSEIFCPMSEMQPKEKFVSPVVEVADISRFATEVSSVVGCGNIPKHFPRCTFATIGEIAAGRGNSVCTSGGTIEPGSDIPLLVEARRRKCPSALESSFYPNETKEIDTSGWELPERTWGNFHEKIANNSQKRQTSTDNIRGDLFPASICGNGSVDSKGTLYDLSDTYRALEKLEEDICQVFLPPSHWDHRETVANPEKEKVPVLELKGTESRGFDYMGDLFFI